MNPETIWDVEALQQSFVDWNGRTINVAGHPMWATSRGKIGSGVKLHADAEAPGTGDPQVNVRMAEPKLDERFRRTDVVVLRGTVNRTIQGHVELVDATFIESREAMPEASSKLSSGEAEQRPVRCDELQAGARGLHDQVIQVRGWFNGWTTSDTGKRVIHAIALQDANRKSADGPTVQVELKNAPPEGLGRPGRIHVIQGRVADTTGDTVKLVDGEIVETDV